MAKQDGPEAEPYRAAQEDWPLLSVIIPLYNRAEKIGRVVAELGGRATASFEVIIVDDGSKDGSAAAARRALAASGTLGQVIEQPNGGPGAARNTGAAAARGRWLVFHDSDDGWFPWTLDLLARQIAETAGTATEPALILFREKEVPETALAEQLATEAEAPPVLRAFPGSLEAMASGSPIAFGACNLAMRRDVFGALDGFSTAIRYAEDNDLIMRASGQGPCLLILAPAMIALSRGGGDHLTGDPRAAIRGFSHILQADRGGAYADGPTGPGARHRVTAAIATKLIRRHYEAGHPARALGIWLRHVPLFLRAGDTNSLSRLPLVPVLATLGLRRYSYFRWRPR